MRHFRFTFPVADQLWQAPRGTSGPSSIIIERHPILGLTGRFNIRPSSPGSNAPLVQELVLPRLQFPVVRNRGPAGFNASILGVPAHDTTDYRLPWQRLHWDQNPTPNATNSTDTIFTFREDRLLRTNGLNWLSNFTLTLSTTIPGTPIALPQVGVNLVSAGPIALQIGTDVGGNFSAGVQVSVESFHHIQFTATVQQGSGSVVGQISF